MGKIPTENQLFSKKLPRDNRTLVVLGLLAREWSCPPKLVPPRASAPQPHSHRGQSKPSAWSQGPHGDRKAEARLESLESTPQDKSWDTGKRLEEQGLSLLGGAVRERLFEMTKSSGTCCSLAI